MDVRTAVKIAKDRIAELFQEERVVNIGLEEVDFDSASQLWRVTIGFSRPWDRNLVGAFVAGTTPEYRRSLKVVIIDETGEVRSVKDRHAENA